MSIANYSKVTEFRRLLLITVRFIINDQLHIIWKSSPQVQITKPVSFNTNVWRQLFVHIPGLQCCMKLHVNDFRLILSFLLFSPNYLLALKKKIVIKVEKCSSEVLRWYSVVLRKQLLNSPLG